MASPGPVCAGVQGRSQAPGLGLSCTGPCAGLGLVLAGDLGLGTGYTAAWAPAGGLVPCYPSSDPADIRLCTTYPFYTGPGSRVPDINNDTCAQLHLEDVLVLMSPVGLHERPGGGGWPGLVTLHVGGPGDLTSPL